MVLQVENVGNVNIQAANYYAGPYTTINEVLGYNDYRKQQIVKNILKTNKNWKHWNFKNELLCQNRCKQMGALCLNMTNQ